MRWWHLIGRAVSFSGAVGSATVFVASAALGTDRWLLGGEPRWGADCAVLMPLLFLALPISYKLKNEAPALAPIIQPSGAARTASRGTAVILLLHTVVRAVLLACSKSMSRLYDAGLAGTICASWLLTICYLYGVRVVCSERYLAISRNPIFLFRRDLLEQYLKDRERYNAESDTGQSSDRYTGQSDTDMGQSDADTDESDTDTDQS
jgi:hypothetical protein